MGQQLKPQQRMYYAQSCMLVLSTLTTAGAFNTCEHVRRCRAGSHRSEQAGLSETLGQGVDSSAVLLDHTARGNTAVCQSVIG